MHREDLYKPLVPERAAARSGSSAPAVPRTFPLELADHLRGEGIELTPDRELSPGAAASRRRPSSTGSAGPSARPRRRWTPRASCFEPPTQNGDGLELDGEPLTSERLKRRIGEVFTEHDMLADEFIVSARRPERGRPRDGLGPIRAGRADRRSISGRATARRAATPT